VRQAEQSGHRTVGIYAGALGFSFNTELLKKKNVAPPRCWSDLLKPAFKGEIQMANPASSGTAYTAVATLVQVMGEPKAFDYLKSLHANINQYTKSGVGPVKAAARGETSVGISFVHDVVTEALAGFPVGSATPCEGTGYEIGSLSIVNGARNLDGARKFVDWALTPAAQALGAKNKQFQLPSNRGAEVPKEAPKLSEMKLIDYDFKKYGSSAERRRLIDRWEKEDNSHSRRCDPGQRSAGISPSPPDSAVSPSRSSQPSRPATRSASAACSRSPASRCSPRTGSPKPDTCAGIVSRPRACSRSRCSSGCSCSCRSRACSPRLCRTRAARGACPRC
jgi:ABC-type Fe3+ transport system substrate-binding protein